MKRNQKGASTLVISQIGRVLDTLHGRGVKGDKQKNGLIATKICKDFKGSKHGPNQQEM